MLARDFAFPGQIREDRSGNDRDRRVGCESGGVRVWCVREGLVRRLRIVSIPQLSDTKATNGHLVYSELVYLRG